ncbi:MAG: hypothetical protein NUV78_01745 [Candidatus Zambryskibacteria bacterium]|nr:hypothetical protein [Candidatus Zambryskibacteria bacterium]
MRTYLATLHQRPPAHKKRFALLTSGIFTLLIFSIWALATFGVTNEATPASANTAVTQPNPFGSLFRGFAVSFQSLIGNMGELKESLEVVNYEAQNSAGSTNTLNTYGQ